MPSASRRRRVVEEEESEEEMPQTQRRRGYPPSESEEDEDEENGEVSGPGGDIELLVKKFVRYALACEYQRIPIRKAAISEKVFLKRREPFKRIFELAQHQLRTKFGMALIELPVREKITMKERRDAIKNNTKGRSKPPVSYILTSILPRDYRTPSVITPSIIGSAQEEAQYIALCTTIVSIIALSHDGSIPNAKLESHLARLNIERNMPMATTANMLKKMTAQGYIYQVVDKSGDDETRDWSVGPRGRVEIGNGGIQRFVEEVYGDKVPEDLAEKLQRTLGVEVGRADGEQEENVENDDPGPNIHRKPGRQRRLLDEDEDED